MPAKTPIYLKVSNNKKGKKCKLRDILSPDMISPPLGDFRHTTHIGKGGGCDAFGDMSFLQGRYELLPGQVEIKSQKYSTHEEFLRDNSLTDTSFPETPSPVLKNAISLPSIGESQALTLPLLSTEIIQYPSSFEKAKEPVPQQNSTPIENGKSHFGENGFTWSTSHQPIKNGKIPHSTNCNGSYSEWFNMNTANGNLADLRFEFTKTKSDSEESISEMTGSLLSLELDLGPSILDDVLNVMDKPKFTNQQ
uniref:CDC42 effector protein (Rho GTPase binding) 3 n=1 Tax=Erpetoichthys calabaricus TaxID=27687 RepID=A0A8C4SS55_ERPCA